MKSNHIQLNRGGWLIAVAAVAGLAVGCVDDGGRGFSDTFELDTSEDSSEQDTGGGSDSSGGLDTFSDVRGDDGAESDGLAPDSADPDATDLDVVDPDAIDPDAIDPDATGPDVQEPPDGQQLFAALCSGCHGPDADGTGLAPQIRLVTRDYATWVIRNGRSSAWWAGTMPSFSEADLSADSVDLILDYLHSFEKPKSGEGLFRVFCANCHGVDGSGGPARKSIDDVAKSDPEELLEMVREGDKPGQFSDRTGYMPKWNDNQITDQEVNLIKTYLQSL